VTSTIIVTKISPAAAEGLISMSSSPHNPPEFLTDVLGPLVSDHPPYVTLTYAQTIDGKIAAEGNERLHVSGPESYDMTHWCDNAFKICPHRCTYDQNPLRMRTMHDAILCGINTALTDDPQLKGIPSWFFSYSFLTLTATTSL
jgi:hypothetical protein